jgi:hypothetical protein
VHVAKSAKCSVDDRVEQLRRPAHHQRRVLSD